MTGFKKFISGMLTAFICMMPLTAHAEDITGVPGGDSADGLWHYNLYDDGTVSITCLDNTITEAVIPSEIDGHIINMIELDCFKDNTNLKKVTLPDTITVLEDYAFYLCSGLEEINIPDSVEKLGFQTFYGCSSLKEITIPANVSEIEGFTFEGCNSLTAVHVNQRNQNYQDKDGVLFTKDGSELLLYPSAKTGTSYAVPEDCHKLEAYAFMANPYLEEINIAPVTEMGEDIFYYCTALKSMTIPEGITFLQGSMFGNCTSLTSVTLPRSLTALGSGCFYNCVKLASITLPDALETVNDYAFFNCASLTSIRVSEHVRTIGEYAFGFYYGTDDELKRLPGFELDADNGTAGFQYAAENSIKCTGGITQGIVFLYIIIGIVVLVIAVVILLIIMQKRYQKQHDIR